jgi:hypothetical protein
MSEPTRIIVWVRWDEEDALWIGGSEQLPGLVLEHTDFDQLVEAAIDATPDLIETNRPELKGLPIHIVADRVHVPA